MPNVTMQAYVEAPEICLSKLKINRPKISFGFFLKKSIGGWMLWKGGGQEKMSLRVAQFWERL